MIKQMFLGNLIRAADGVISGKERPTYDNPAPRGDLEIGYLKDARDSPVDIGADTK